MTLLRAFWDAAREVDPERAAAADEGVVMRWCADGELAELWRTVELREVHFGPLAVRATYTDFEDLWSPIPTAVAPSGAFCKSPETPAWDEQWKRCADSTALPQPARTGRLRSGA